jgi:hypothetical protein
MVLALAIAWVVVRVADHCWGCGPAGLRWHARAGRCLFLAFLFVQSAALALIPICLLAGHYLGALPEWYANGGSHGSHGPWRHIPPLMNLMETSLLLTVLGMPLAFLAAVLRPRVRILLACVLLAALGWGVHIRMHWLVD